METNEIYNSYEEEMRIPVNAIEIILNINSSITRNMTFVNRYKFKVNMLLEAQKELIKEENKHLMNATCELKTISVLQKNPHLISSEEKVRQIVRNNECDKNRMINIYLKTKDNNQVQIFNLGITSFSILKISFLIFNIASMLLAIVSTLIFKSLNDLFHICT